MNHPAEQDVAWMRQALALAAGVMNITTPNPRVGCVIVRDGQVLGQGATQRAGGPHAEICALRDAAAAGHDVAGSTFYVTLEPCSHHGRTPPCVNAVLAARPARVVIAMNDPNPLVNGRGLAQLRQADIQVTTGVCLDEALEQNAGFISRMTRTRPWLWLKLAGSLDGRSALHNGVSQWITGEAARADGHRWRARSCAVMTGIGTVLADDPMLTPRAVATPRMPRRIIIDTHLRTPPRARILDGEEVWIFTGAESASGNGNAGDAAADAAAAAHLPAEAAQRAEHLRECNARIIPMPLADGHVDLAAVMQWLGRHDINEVHVEAGAKLNGALLQTECVDELIAYVAPMLLGDATPLAQLPTLAVLPGRRDFTFTETRLLGGDAFLRARRSSTWEALRQAVQAVATA